MNNERLETDKIDKIAHGSESSQQNPRWPGRKGVVELFRGNSRGRARLTGEERVRRSCFTVGEEFARLRFGSKSPPRSSEAIRGESLDTDVL